MPSLEDARLIFIKAVRDYLATSRLSAIEYYCHGNQDKRREVIRFAVWVRKNGEPTWFEQCQQQVKLDL